VVGDVVDTPPSFHTWRREARDGSAFARYACSSVSSVDPYASPVAPAALTAAAPVAPPVRLFSAEAIATHALVMTPVVGSLLAAINHRRLGHGAALRRTLLAYTAPSAILFIAQFVETDRPLGGPLRIGGFVWTVSVAYRLYGEHQVLFAKHVATGGRPAPWYLATLAVMGVVMAGLVLLFASELLVAPGGAH
jgi:hypothetical protein